MKWVMNLCKIRFRRTAIFSFYTITIGVASIYLKNHFKKKALLGQITKQSLLID